MKITLKCFACLSHHLPAEAKGNRVVIDIAEKTTVQQLIDDLNIDTEMVELAILNNVFIEPSQRSQTPLKAQDTLALWPEVAGG